MRQFSLLAFGLALSWPAIASAQKKPNLDGERIVAEFARCAVRTTPGEAALLLETVPGSESERQKVEDFLIHNFKCLNLGASPQAQQLSAEVSLGRISAVSALSQFSASPTGQQMRLSNRVVRGAVAERVYLDSAKHGPTATSGAVSDVTGGPVGYAVVQCAVARDPFSADRLVRAKRLSPAEQEAAKVLAPSLAACAQGKGRVDFSGTAIHGWAAEALYKQGRADATKGR